MPDDAVMGFADAGWRVIVILILMLGPSIIHGV